MSEKTHKSYRMIYPLYGLILLTATLIVTLFYQERYDQRIQRLKAEFSESALHIDNLLSIAVHHVGLMQTALMNPFLPQDKTLPQVTYHGDWGGYSVDLEVQTEHGVLRDHLTGGGMLDLQDPEFRSDYLTALSLAPLIADTKDAVPSAAWVYYLSRRHFILAAPWADPQDLHFTTAFYDLPFYRLGTPQHNPARRHYWTGTYLDAYGQGQMVTVGAPVYVRDDFQGIVAIGLTLRQLSENLFHHNPGETLLFIRNREGQILAHPGLSENMGDKILRIEDILQPGLSPEAMPDVTSGKEMDYTQGYLVFNLPLAAAPWSLMAIIDEAELRREVLLDMQTEFFILILLGIAIVLVEYNRRTHRALHKSEHRFREMSDLLPEIIYETNGHGRIRFMNLTGLTRLGYSRSSLEHGIFLKDLYYRVETESPLPASLLPDSRNIEYKVICSDGSSFPALLRTAPIKEGGLIKGERGILIDISKLKAFQSRLETLAITDPLTGCYNHRMFIELTNKEINRSQRSRRNACLLMLDLDFFKRINDNWGHQAGDDALVHFVNLCRRNLREGDILGRMGGEEFAILMPDTDLENAEIVAERIRSMLEHHPVLFHSTKIPLTVSIGITEVTAEGIEIALSHADQALYEAKHLGRNRVISWLP